MCLSGERFETGRAILFIQWVYEGLIQVSSRVQPLGVW